MPELRRRPSHADAETPSPQGLSEAGAIVPGMTEESGTLPPSAKADLLRYLHTAREAMVWKLDGLSEYDARRPLVPTGTNLLGLLKHLASVEAGYFGPTFGRPFPGTPFPWYAEGADPNDDFVVEADQSLTDVLDFYRRVWAHADETIASLPLDAEGHVAWWPPERNPVTLHRILVHVATETYRHAGHADILRELIDGVAGHNPTWDNLWSPKDGWPTHFARVEGLAQGFRG